MLLLSKEPDRTTWYLRTLMTFTLAKSTPHFPHDAEPLRVLAEALFRAAGRERERAVSPVTEGDRRIPATSPSTSSPVRADHHFPHTWSVTTVYQQNIKLSIYTSNRSSFWLFVRYFFKVNRSHLAMLILFASWRGRAGCFLSLGGGSFFLCYNFIHTYITN